MNTIGNLIGDICKKLLPIPEEIYFGNSESSLSICTLSSIDLLKKIANSNLIDEISVVGRLLSENKGIDALIQYVISHKQINSIFLCGKDVWGHRAGHSLLSLYEYGIDENGRIINSTSPEPILHSSQQDVDSFRKQIQIINEIGNIDFSKIYQQIMCMKHQ